MYTSIAKFIDHPIPIKSGFPLPENHGGEAQSQNI
jgi:hypothetical protein